MSAYHLVLRESFLDTLSGTVARPGDGLVESGKFAEILQVPVHQLVGKHRQRTAAWVFLVLILVQYSLGKAVKVDGKPVISLDGGDVHRIALDVRPFEIGQIGIAQGSEGAETEAVPGLLQAAGILDRLLVFLTIHVKEFHLRSVLGNLEIVQVKQFLLGEEDDRLFQYLELGT